ncbi:semaphorin-5A-like [Mya arenaria]|uniref:semaphorin-5A-like n=1 Tax=Mya arenaria TaxID=6604 RepID=UPI0022E5D7CF|nr:semaphorin-5A-like [Mya arenaria]
MGKPNLTEIFRSFLYIFFCILSLRNLLYDISSLNLLNAFLHNNMLQFGWLPWSEWSQCSGSCGDGMKTRQRTCQNAAMSHLLGNCTGQNVELVQCSQWNCSATVLFRAREVADYTLSTINQTIIFSEMLFNVGEGYNSSTGKFTAPVTGIYLFTVNLCPLRSGYIFYAVVAKEDVVANGHSFNVSGYNCVSGNTIVQINANDIVYVKSTYNLDKLLHNELHDRYDAKSNSFSGVLLH